MVEEKFSSKEKIRQNLSLADFSSYFVGLIGRMFRLIFRKEIQPDAEMAFAYFIMTFGLIISIAGFPKSFVDLKHFYWLGPFIFFLYFLVVAGQNWEKFDRFFKKFQQKTELAFDDIIENRVTQGQLGLSLSTISFDLNQITQIIGHLQNKNQFSPLAQFKLVSNRNLYKIETFPFIKDSILSEEWDVTAVCKFLYRSNELLDEKYIMDLVEKYKKHKSVLFCVGRHHKYKPILSVDDEKLFNAGFTLKTKGFKISRLYEKSVFWIFMFLVVIGLLFFRLFDSNNNGNISHFFIGAGFIIIGFLQAFSWNGVYKGLLKREINNELKANEVKLPHFEYENFLRNVPFDWD